MSQAECMSIWKYSLRKTGDSPIELTLLLKKEPKETKEPQQMRSGTGANKTASEDIPSTEVKAAGAANLILLQKQPPTT